MPKTRTCAALDLFPLLLQLGGKILRPGSGLVARSGLGTLNHTLLSLEALAARGLRPRALFLVGEAHKSNRATLARARGVTRVFEVPTFSLVEESKLDAWIASNDLGFLFT